MKKLFARELLPEYPRTPHLPINPNLDEGDIVAAHWALQDLIEANPVFVEEKVDGTNIGISYYQGHFYIRNRRRVLRKGSLPKNPSGRQFLPLWNWLHDNQGKFQLLQRLLGFEQDEPVTVYGEWMWMAHGIQYTDLPDFLIAFDIYDPKTRKFFEQRDKVRNWLTLAKFSVPPLLHCGQMLTEPGEKGVEEVNRQFLSHLMSHNSQFASSVEATKVEGLYFRFHHNRTGHPQRYKMVRSDFERGKFFRETEIVRNLTTGN